MDGKIQPPYDNMVCPFCGEPGFDLMGLKHHLDSFGVWTGYPLCVIYHELTWENQEEVTDRLREAKHGNLF